MTTNPNGHTVWNLTNRVMAVIDDAGKAQAAVDTLLHSCGAHFINAYSPWTIEGVAA